MAHNIDMSNGQANVAYLGSRKDIWHRLGQEMVPGMSISDWAKAAGLDWSAIQVPAYADLTGPEFAHLPERDRMKLVDNAIHTVRSDNGGVLGFASERRREHQPTEVLEWFQEYISADPRFAVDVAGSLKGGRIIWATAIYNGDLTVGGDKHRARLLMTTTFDGTASTKNKMTMDRAICNNTLDVALTRDLRAVVTTRHNTRFNPDKVSRELAALAQSVDSYKKMGDAMAAISMPKEDIVKMFRACLDIEPNAKSEDISTRKLNQFDELTKAYVRTVQEGTAPNTAWSALQAVTRYVDHDRGTRGGNNETESRFLSAQFGSGASMKQAAVEYLCEMPTGVDAYLANALKAPLVTRLAN